MAKSIESFLNIDSYRHITLRRKVVLKKMYLVLDNVRNLVVLISLFLAPHIGYLNEGNSSFQTVVEKSSVRPIVRK